MKNSIFTRSIDKIRKLGKLTPMALATMFLPMLGAAVLIAFGAVFGNWLRENWELGSLLYLSVILVFCGLSLMTTNLIGIIGGWAFGMNLGLALLMAGICGAALISFFIHRRIIGDKVPELAGESRRAGAIYNALVNEGFWRSTGIICLVRLSGMPFPLANFLLASAKVSWKAYLTGTLFGMLPRSGAVVFAGAGFSELNFENPIENWIILLGIVATIALAIVITILSRRALDKLTGLTEAKASS